MDVHPGIDRVVDRPPTRDSARAAIEEIRAAAAGGRNLARHRPRLRASVSAFVGELRGAGVPVERTIEKVIDLVRDADGTIQSADAADPLLTDVVRIGIEAYYDDPALRGVPRFF